MQENKIIPFMREKQETFFPVRMTTIVCELFSSIQQTDPGRMDLTLEEIEIYQEILEEALCVELDLPREKVEIDQNLEDELEWNKDEQRYPLCQKENIVHSKGIISPIYAQILCLSFEEERELEVMRALEQAHQTFDVWERMELVDTYSYEYDAEKPIQKIISLEDYRKSGKC